MAAIDFPNSPSVNDLFTVNDRTWKYVGEGIWDTVEEAVVGPTGPAGAAGPTGPAAIVLQAEEPSVTNVVWVDTDEEPTNNLTKAVVGAGEFNTSIPAGSYLVNSKSNFKIGATLYPAATDTYFSFTTTVTSVTKYLDTLTPTGTGGIVATDLAYLNNNYISWLPQNPDTIVGVSTNGITWTTSAASGISIRKIVYGDNKYVAFGFGPSDGTPKIQTSTDGITWTSRNHVFTGSASPGNAIAYGNGVFVAAAGTNNPTQIAVSTDGITWATGAVGFTSTTLRLVYGNGIFLAAVGSDSATSSYSLTSSTDGITWTTTSMYGNSAGLYMLEFVNNQFWFAERRRNGGSGVELTFDTVLCSTTGTGFTWQVVLRREGFSSQDGYSKIGYGSGYYAIDITEETEKISALISSDGIVWSTTALTNGFNRGLLEGTTLVTTRGNYPVTSRPTVFQPIEDYTVPN